VDRLIQLVRSSDNDISKNALYGCAFFARPTDIALLDSTMESHQIEGMTRLLRTLERKPGGLFTDFFLKVAMNHEILDIQEMAMQALGDTPEVHTKVRSLLESDSPENKRTALRIIGEIKCTAFKGDMLALLEGQSDIIRIEAISSLGKLGDPEVLQRINDVMYDAKSLVLIEICLRAMAQVGSAEGIVLLQDYSEKTRNKKTAVVAIELLVESYKFWSRPLPVESHETILKHLKTWFEDRDATIRMDAYRIASLIITLELDIYNVLKNMFKDASTRLRAQPTWDKKEMAQVDESLRVVNRNFFFLKDMQEYCKEVSNRCRNHDHESSTTRIAVFEKLISLLESNDKFLNSAENEVELETVVMKGLEMESGSWREQSLLFKIAGFCESEVVKDELVSRIKTVPKQSKTYLMDALAHMGYGLSEIKDLAKISTILVIEGSGFYRKKLVNHLKVNGYQVRDIGDVDLGKAMIQSSVPDLVITEVSFGTEQSGITFFEETIKAYGSRIQFVFSTNNRERVLMERIIKNKPLSIFHKPYPFEKLDEAIKG